MLANQIFLVKLIDILTDGQSNCVLFKKCKLLNTDIYYILYQIRKKNKSI